MKGPRRGLSSSCSTECFGTEGGPKCPSDCRVTLFLFLSIFVCFLMSEGKSRCRRTTPGLGITVREPYRIDNLVDPKTGLERGPLLRSGRSPTPPR